MNLGNTVSGIDIQPSFKLWWNKYHIKAEVKGNWLIHDPMVLEEIYKFQNQYCWDTIKFAWHKNYSVYFSDSKVAKKFIRKFKDSIISVQGIRSQKEYNVVVSNNKLLRRKLFFNKYRYVMYKYWPEIYWLNKVNKLNMDARVSTHTDRYKCTIYLGKLQLSVGNTEDIFKVVTLEEL